MLANTPNTSLFMNIITQLDRVKLMSRLFKLIFLVLMISVVPFLIFGQSLELSIENWLRGGPSPATMFFGVVGLLATDIFLPIPSSAVCTLAGRGLGFAAATAASWCGMTLGAVFGFWLARVFGAPLAGRLSDSDDLADMEALSRRMGPLVLVLTRPVPVCGRGRRTLVWHYPLKLGAISSACCLEQPWHRGRLFGAWQPGIPERGHRGVRSRSR